MHHVERRRVELGDVTVITVVLNRAIAKDGNESSIEPIRQRTDSWVASTLYKVDRKAIKVGDSPLNSRNRLTHLLRRQVCRDRRRGL